MHPSEIRKLSAKEAAAFLDKGKEVDQGHLRNALANALERIAKLEENAPSRDATDEVLNSPSN